MNPWDQFTGANAGYVHELYERYQQDPWIGRRGHPPGICRVGSVGRRWHHQHRPLGADPRGGGTAELKAGIAAFNLAESIRRFGHLAARLDPLGFDDAGRRSVAERRRRTA